MTGEKRNEQKLLVAANGVTNTRVENLNYNFNIENPSNYQMLFIKYLNFYPTVSDRSDTGLIQSDTVWLR